MTAFWCVELRCDHDGCDATFSVIPAHSYTHARAEAIEEGWEHHRGRDYCSPAHDPRSLVNQASKEATDA